MKSPAACRRSPGKNVIEATFPFNDEVLSEAYAMHRAVRRWTKWLRFFAWLACAWGVWLLAKEQRWVLGGIVLGAGALVLIWPRIARALWLRVIRENAFYGAEVHCQFDTTGFVFAANGQGIKVPWEDTFKIVEGETGYLIYPKSGAFYYIPGRGFATDIDAERVKGLFLSEKMRRT
jgi:hypothetical protein